MSIELDARAARAMGWVANVHPNTGWVWEPSTDRNDLAELIAEVERRGLSERYDREIYTRVSRKHLDRMRAVELLMADPAIICEVACEVLEADNG